MDSEGFRILACVVIVSLATMTNGQIPEEEMPREIKECIHTLTLRTNMSDLAYLPENIHIRCLQEFMWKFGDVQWEKFNVTEKDKKFVNSLIGSLVYHSRQKRQVGPGGVFPSTGFRIRREYRRLTDFQRFIFHDTLRRMKNALQYDTFARMHSGIAVNSAHQGPNFPGWHRVYLALFEEAMRRITPGFPVSLPYWDSTLDNDMANPVNSIIWTPSFLGNGNGQVTTGPFVPWVIDGVDLIRNIGGGSQLFSKEVVGRILTRCRNEEILTPTALPDFDFEFYHGGPHVWVGGLLSFLNTAAYDPLFFMHHAYVDYIWEMFRIRQASFCGINPETDYPTGPGSTGLHAPDRPMDGFPQYRNIDGYRNYWTQFWYRYELSPTCSILFPNCGTPYLRCDIARQRCVSVEAMGPAPIAAGTPAGAAAFAGTPASNMRARALEASIAPRAGPRFRAPPAEPRTQDAQIAMATMAGRRKRAAEQAQSENSTVTTGKRIPLPVNPSPGEQFSAFSTTGRKGVPFALSPPDNGMNDSSIAEGRAFSQAEPMPLLPLPEYHDTSVNDLLKPHVQNDFIINGKADKSLWSFVPVKIIYTNHPDVSMVAHASQLGQSSPDTQNKCIQDESGAIQVKVQSYGINYSGSYTNYALIDKHLPIDSAITYIGIRTPELSGTKVIFSAVHSCGTLCQARCLIPNSSPPVFQTCTGMLGISPNDPTVYGPSVEETAARTWQGNLSTDMQATNIHIVFHCSNN